jgi:small-conductance mechanosensitive channel
MPPYAFHLTPQTNLPSQKRTPCLKSYAHIANRDILSTKITNWILSNSQQRLEMDLSVNGPSDMEIVSSTIKKAILSSQYVLPTREPQILFSKINGEGFDLKVFFWCSDAFKCEEAKSEILVLLHDQMKAENIDMN